MASRKKRTPAAFERGREFKLRLPPDVSERVEAKAKAEGRPQNRVIINELAAFPDLERLRKFGELVGDMENVLARYSSRIMAADLGEALMHAVDDVLKADRHELQARLDRLRVLRNAMLKRERVSKE
jgi:hypothetical protein